MGRNPFLIEVSFLRLLLPDNQHLEVSQSLLNRGLFPTKRQPKRQRSRPRRNPFLIEVSFLRNSYKPNKGWVNVAIPS